MKNAIVLAVALLTAASVMGQTDRKDIIGLWLSEDRDGKVEIYEKENGTFGGCTRWMIVNGIENPPLKDAKNPDPAKRNQMQLGMEIMYNFTYKDGEWRYGKIYDPRSGKTYSAKIKLKEGDKNTLILRGFLGISLFGQSTVWTRITK